MRSGSKALLILLFFTLEMIALAQSQVTIYTDQGSIQTSDGIFLRSSIQGQYELKKHTISVGIQSNLIGYNPSIISAVACNVSRDIDIKRIPIRLQAFYIWNGLGELIKENNWAGFLHLKQRKFNIKLGYHFRTLYYSKQAISNYSLQYPEAIYENWNLIYAFDYYLKPQDHIWNIGICATNMDHYIINQETNPLFCLKGNYRLKKEFELYLESWYKSAGALNLSVNYFGFFIRTGIKWNIRENQ